MTKECIHCHKTSLFISSPLNLCIDCIRSHYHLFKEHINKIHAETRKKFSLPPKPPKDKDGLLCDLCINRCVIPNNGKGYCGIRKNSGGKLKELWESKNKGLFDWYFDQLPTNCVASPMCPGGSDSGYPRYSYKKGPEYGFRNLSIFYRACSFNCLFCQNWQFKKYSQDKIKDSQELIDSIDEKTSCICFFGGDPTPQLPHAIELSKKIIKQKKGKIIRICWETNGTMNDNLLREMACISFRSGGSIKFDLKAYNDSLHKAICGISNHQTLKNFKSLGKFVSERPDPPFLIASTLLIPGYIDTREVSQIASFIASVNPEIPYSLLGFAPHFFMDDLPRTPKKLAYECYQEAKKAGLKRITIGNPHILTD